MKKILILLLILSCVTEISIAQSNDKAGKLFNKNVKELWPMLDSLRTLIYEGKNGFVGRFGKRLADGEDGSIRYAAKMECLKADVEYISVKDGKTFYNLEWNSKKGNADVDFCYSMFDNGKNPNLLLVRENIDFCMPKEPKDGWSFYDFREKYETPALGTMKVLGKNTKTVMCIGQVEDKQKLHYVAQEKFNRERISILLAEYKSTGIQEIDSINISIIKEKLWQGYENEDPIKNLPKIADNNYGNSIGAAYTAYDGITRYKAPLWFAADSAYFVYDNTNGFGYKLYLFFAHGKPNTSQMVKNMRAVLMLRPAATEGAHPFIYAAGTGENPFLMYRYESSNDAPYKGLTVIVTQTRFLEEKLAKQKVQDAIDKKYRDGEKEISNLPTKICECCNGTGRRRDTQFDYMKGGKPASSAIINCSCCQGNGRIKIYPKN